MLTTSGLTSATFDIAVPSNVSIGFISNVVAKETSLHIGALSNQAGSISNNAGTVVMDGAVISLASVINAGLAGITTIFTANGTNLRMTVTGVVALNIDWQYEIELIQN